ncbi:ThuA domain-containing protein [Limnoglobus roseus]|uniref:Trehalose utilization n=1 Tax=Limnoglobus roseus TaxID=2598579 RepID=A0A5C1APF5_9BACT|nr:ThuA domain-containing protein [Limnoglobus roseus]QEL21051.1 trehalose utilization [Limnoglobus roseus]
MRSWLSILALLALTLPMAAQDAAKRSLADPPVEELPTDPKLTKIVLVAGSTYYKPGEHEYVGGCAVLMDLLRQTPGVFPVLAIDWPKKPETFAGAKGIVFLTDGGDKHPFLKDDHFAQIQKLLDGGVGLVQLHQDADYPTDFGERVRAFAGAAWEKGYSQRAHWVSEFKDFPKHDIFNGVKPFKINDGWLWTLRFAKDPKGVTPLLRTWDPKAKAAKKADLEDVIAWAFDRPNGGRTFTFTGGHLHASFAEEGYRRFLVNGILWSAKQDIPATGAKVDLDAATLPKYLKPAPAKK